MYFYEVFPISNKYRGATALTYSSEQKLRPGHIVSAPMRQAESTAIVVKQTPKPSFPTKSIIALLNEKPLAGSSLKLIEWLQSYYPAPVSSLASLFVPNDLSTKSRGQTRETTKHTVSSLPVLTTEQRQIVDKIHSTEQSTFLLHGVTGSGKTRVYTELIQETLDANKSALVLTPEISLTPQLTNYLQTHLSAEVLIVHSNLTPKERRELWLKIHQATKPQVIVGPRSALFSPANNLGLIIVDEFHDTAYKQEQSPYYQSLRVAGALSSIHGARLVYGSATPTISEYYIAQQRDIPILNMRELAINSQTTANVVVVDAKDRQNYSRNSYFSDHLLTAIQQSLDNSEQSLVFLNRRGTARVVLCQNCGWQALCPNCDLPLTYHGDSHTLRCHTCGFKQQPPVNCPECSSPDIIYKSFGTKSIETQLRKLFPQARIKRFDTDNTKQERFDQQYREVVEGKVDILVGTQLLVKGLDLPKLSTVGVVAAESSLSFPDYTADEQTYQLLTQVIGRVARGHRAGTIIVQSYEPTGLSLQSAVNKDWAAFYEAQLAERQQYLFPPFCYLLKLTCSRKSQASASQAAAKLAELIRTLPIRVQIVGPSPRFIEKTGGEYHWQLTLKAKDRRQLLTVIDNLPANWHYDIDPSNLL